MKVRFASFVGLCFAILLSFVLAFSAVAQDKAPKKAAKADNVQGTVTSIKKDTSTITVNTGKAQRQVTYSATTRFMSGHSNDNKAGTLDKVQMNNFISCAGATDNGVLKATDCLYRDKK
jgi:hypothetical protein